MYTGSLSAAVDVVFGLWDRYGALFVNDKWIGGLVFLVVYKGGYFGM